VPRFDTMKSPVLNSSELEDSVEDIMGPINASALVNTMGGMIHERNRSMMIGTIRKDNV
jgi:hypothetical protein